MADEPEAEKKLQRPQPYTKPKIEWEEPFEPVTSAISCAKRPGQGVPSCTAAPRL
ncbi:MAG: hypothetical protein HY208_09125 [Nitrospirae bacterium]|nr:hypothetical protein [Nitrospirota bacterium]